MQKKWSRITILVIAVSLLIFISLVIGCLSSFVLYTIASNLKGKKPYWLNHDFNYALFNNTRFLPYMFINALIVFVIMLAISIKYYRGLSLTKNQTKKVKKEDKVYGNAKFILNENDAKPNYNLFNKIYEKNFFTPSFIMKTEIIKDKVNFYGVDCSTLVNNLVIGSTGSGKSKRIIEPMLVANSSLDDEIVLEKKLNKKKTEKIIVKCNKPNFIVTDTKGELYYSQRDYLKSQGYDVFVIDFKNLVNTDSWDIFVNIKYYFNLYLNYEKNNVKTHDFINKEFAQEFLSDYVCIEHKKNDCEMCLLSLKIVDDKTSVIVFKEHKIWFYDYWKSQVYIKTYAQHYKQKALDEISIIVETIIELDSTGDNRSWFVGAQNLLKGTIIAMLEVYEKYSEHFRENWFNIFNACDLVNDPKRLIEFFDNTVCKIEDNKSYALVNSILSLQEKIRDQYFSILNQSISAFKQESLKNVLCKDSVNIFDFDSEIKPRALFIVIPDDEKTKYPIISIMLTQIYQTLYYLASLNETHSLKRTTLFLLDEFANITRIENLDQIVNTSRSRKIFTTMIVQDLAQIEAKYKQQSRAIRSACLLMTYLNSMSIETNTEISRLCGKNTLNVSHLETDKNRKASYSLTGVDLVVASELNSVVKEDKALLIDAQSGISITTLLNIYDFKHLLEQEFYQWKNKTEFMIDFYNDYYVNFNNLNYEVKLQSSKIKLQDALSVYSIKQNEINKKVDELKENELVEKLTKKENSLRKDISKLSALEQNVLTTEDKLLLNRNREALRNILELKHSAMKGNK